MPRDPHKDQPILVAGAPLAEAAGALVLLHGRGGSAQDMLALARDLLASSPSAQGGEGAPKGLPSVALKHSLRSQGRGQFAWLVPEAAGRQWYPYSLLEKVERNRSHLASALALLKRALARAEAANVPLERVVLLGFSQGASVALEFAARNARRYGGLVALSGALLGPEGTPRDYPGSLAGTPVFLGSGDVDPHLPKRRVDETAAVFERLGATVTKRIYRRSRRRAWGTLGPPRRSAAIEMTHAVWDVVRGMWGVGATAEPSSPLSASAERGKGGEATMRATGEAARTG